MAHVRNLALLLTSAAVLGACSTTSDYVSPADIPPVYKIRNSPLPVPDPKWNPRRLAHKGARAQVRARETRPQPTVSKKPTPKQTVSASSASTHVVRKGETLYALSRQYGVPVRSLITANRLRAPYALAIGQKIRIPSNRTHTVRKGETGYSISRQYGVTVSALMSVNGIRPPYSLAIGQELKLPGGAEAPAATTSRSTRSATTTTATKKRGRSVALPAPPPRSRSGFDWPLRGKLASRFGPKEGGLHNDGINIIADQGTPIRAADAGVVVYASNALEGYGNLLLLKHAGGWITAYAHAERILVSPGQKVNRGDIVGRVGSTGGVSTPQLHFEIRKGRQALDPFQYLPK